jgi:hypothetical protein
MEMEGFGKVRERTFQVPGEVTNAKVHRRGDETS